MASILTSKGQGQLPFLASAATIFSTKERDSSFTVGTTIVVVSNSVCIVYAGLKAAAACKGLGQLPSFASPATIVRATDCR